MGVLSGKLPLEKARAAGLSVPGDPSVLAAPSPPTQPDPPARDGSPYGQTFWHMRPDSAAERGSASEQADQYGGLS